jgi:hypothetical protein
MHTKRRHELRHARKAWPGTLVGPCLLSGSHEGYKSLPTGEFPYKNDIFNIIYGDYHFIRQNVIQTHFLKNAMNKATVIN